MLLNKECLYVFRRKNIAPSELADAFYQLARLLDAGICLDESLVEVSSVSANRRVRHLWRRLARDVAAGKSLSDALPQVIPSIDTTVLAFVKAGETSGRIQQACQSANQHLRWQIALRQRLVTILIYPLFSVSLLIIVTGYLFVSVVPAIEGFLSSSSVDLAWHTHLLVRLSSWVSWFYANALTGSVLVIATSVTAVYRSRYLRAVIDKWMLYIPAVGTLVSELSLSRYTNCCAQLYSSGVALDQSMALAEATVNNAVIRSELTHVRASLVGGMSLGESMRKVSMLPAITSRMIQIGESAGQLAPVLTTLSELNRQSAEVAIKRLEQLIAPVLLLCVGLVLLWIVVSVLAPVYNLAIDTVMEAG